MSYSLLGMDTDSLAERILFDLNNTFKKDPLIDEFDILPVDDSAFNKCPVIHTEHKVALESWCVKHVYLYAYKNIMKWRQHLCKIDNWPVECLRIDARGGSHEQTCKRKSNQTVAEEGRLLIDINILLSWTGVVLLINPDVQTAWNVRKELIKNKLQDMKRELKFTEVALSHKPKSSEVFAHRKWVLLEFMKSQPSECSSLETIKHELFVCLQVANRYSNNYYAWSHRTWVIQALVNSCVKVIEEELEATKQWVSTHVSDHSGFHYRQFLISYFKNLGESYPTCSRITCPFYCDSSSHPESLFHDNMEKCHQSSQANLIIEKELALINDLINIFPGHETLWNHRRFVISQIVQMTPPTKNQLTLQATCTGYLTSDDSVCHKKYKLEPYSTCQDWSLAKEEKFILQYFQKANDDWEKKILQRYISWLKRSKILINWSSLSSLEI